MENQVGAESRPESTRPNTAWIGPISTLSNVPNHPVSSDAGTRSTVNCIGEPREIDLHCAIRQRNPSLVVWLLDKGANPNTQDENGHRPLHLAAELGDDTITGILLDHSANPDLETGLRLGGMSIHCINMSPLHFTAKNGAKAVAAKLLGKNANVNIATPLEFHTPLSLAVENGHCDMTELLLKHGANANGDSRALCSPLITAISKKRKDLVQVLCASNCDLNQRDENGDTALHAAAANGSSDLVELLLKTFRDKNQTGIDLDLKGGSGRPAWWLAQRSRHYEIKELLRSAPEWYKNEVAKFSMDIFDDCSLSFREIGVQKLRNDICRAQDYLSCTQSLGTSDGWKQRLRFVIRSKEKTHDYEVIEPFRHGYDNQEPFFAVSYCWTSREKDPYDFKIKVPNKLGDGSEVRELRVRSEILTRALNFAQARGIRQVWIDQECIHQGDDEDKNTLIAAMHRIYRQATLTVVIMGEHIQSVDDIQAIKFIVSGSIPTQPDHVALMERSQILSGRIFNDRWFRRAWTTQEAIISGSETLVYLVGWNQNLDKEAIHWKQMVPALPCEFPRQDIPRQLVLDGRTVWYMSFVCEPGVAMKAMSFATMQRHTKLLHDAILRSSNSKQYEYVSSSSDQGNRNVTASASATPNYQRRSEADFSAHKQSLVEDFETHGIAITALFSALRGKENSLTRDRPSIMANLARYQYHLNMDKLVKENPGISYTACIFALSLANGDTSLLIDSSSQDTSVETQPSKISWLEEDKSLITGYPITKTEVEGPRPIIASPCVVVGSKLLIQGVLWHISTCGDLLPLQEDMQKLVRYCNNYPERARLVGLEVLKAALRLFFNNDKVELVGLFMTMARQRNWSSPTEYQSTMQKLKDWHSGGSWPPLPPKTWVTLDEPSIETDTACIQDIKIDASDNVSRFENLTMLQNNKLLEQIPEEWGDGLLRWIYRCTILGVSFPIGKSHASQGCDEDYSTAVFKMNIEEIPSEPAPMMFVPASELKYDFGGEQFWGPTSTSLWRVQEMKTAVISEEDITDAQKKLRKIGYKDLMSMQSMNELSIIASNDIKGIWSPLLYTNRTSRVRLGWVGLS